jgi:hypothetical protein
MDSRSVGALAGSRMRTCATQVTEHVRHIFVAFSRQELEKFSLRTFLTSVMARDEYNCRLSFIIRVGCERLDALYEQNTPRSILLLLRLNVHRRITSGHPCESYAQSPVSLEE